MVEVRIVPDANSKQRLSGNARFAGIIGVELVIFIMYALYLVKGCSETHFVPVCSEHGGVQSSTVTDKADKFATWDYVCKDGKTQRPEQIEDATGDYHLAVPSTR